MQPTVLKKIATAFHVTTDWLVFDEGERDLPNDLQLKFEAVTQMSAEDQKAIQALIDGMILKHTARQLAVERRNKQKQSKPIGTPPPFWHFLRLNVFKQKKPQKGGGVPIE